MEGRRKTIWIFENGMRDGSNVAKGRWLFGSKDEAKKEKEEDAKQR